MSEKPIRVLQFICPTGFYGAERWVLALAKNSRTEFVHNELAVTYESPEQDLEIVNQFPEPLPSYKLTMSGRFDTSVISKLVELIKEREIDVIHTHGYKSDILGVIAARKAGIISVSTPHGFGTPEGIKLKLFVRLGAFSLRFFDAVAPLSRQLEDEVLQFGVARDKCHYIQNAVDLTEIDPYLDMKQPRQDTSAKGQEVQKTNKKKVGFIGQMIPRKNIKDAIDIFNTLWLEDNQMEFLLLGDGESRNELEEYAKSLPSCADIQFLGFRNDRLNILKDLDLFVMTSSSEGIPRCLMEACAMEIPIAAYNILGIDQLVEHEKTGLLAPFGDKAALTEYWRKLLNDTLYADTLAKSAREFILQQFSGQRLADEYYQLFKSLIDDNKPYEQNRICVE